MADILEDQSKLNVLRPAPRKSRLDILAQSAVERCSDRRQIARPGRAA